MKDQELYDDLLAMQERAFRTGHFSLGDECYRFRMELLDRYFRSIDSSYAAAVDCRMRNGIGWQQ